MTDPFDVTNSDTPDNATANFFRNLQAFGANTMQAANTYGPNGFLTYGAGPMGAIGVGLNAAAQQSRENAQAQAGIGKTQAETAGLRNTNALFPLQLQQAQFEMDMLRRMTNGNGNTAGGNGSSGNIGQALILNKMSPGLGNAVYTNDPNVVGAKAAAESGSTFHETPEGTFIQPGGGGNSAPRNPNTGQNGQGGSSAGATNAPQTISRPSQVSQTDSDNMKELYPDAVPQPSPQKSLVSKDGKPIIPQIQNWNDPDPSGFPKYNTPNTKSGVAMATNAVSEDSETNKQMTAQALNLQNEITRLDYAADKLKQFKAGTLTAGNLETANQLIAWGIIKDPKEIATVSGLQSALQNLSTTTINQLKDTNANFGGAPTRIFAPELTTMQKNSSDPKIQPDALFSNLTQARAIAMYHQDMINGWDSIGGLGNRLMPDGSTLRPNQYIRLYVDPNSHDMKDYTKLAEKVYGSFAGQQPANQDTTNWNIAPTTKTKYRVIQ